MQAIVEALVALPLGLDLDVAHEHQLATAMHEAAARLAAVRPHDVAAHEAEVGAEVRGQPAVVGGRLPGARPPGVVAQAEAVDREAPAVDLEHARGAVMLLVVPARELHVVRAMLGRLASEHRAGARDREIERHGHERVVLEGAAGIAHRERIGEVAGLALVRDRETLEGRQGLEAHAARLEAAVVGDLGALEVEEHGTVRLVEADRGLGVALVGTVADACEAADALRRVEEVEVHALVEVRLAGVLVQVLVGGLEADPRGHGAPPAASVGEASGKRVSAAA